MDIDLYLFQLVNALAGRAGWLDAAGRALAVWGPLCLLLVLLVLLWWRPAEGRRHGLAALLATALGVLGALLEHWLVVHVLGHEVRARPANAVWATVLLAEETHLAFPAWRMVVAASAASLGWYLDRRVGGWMWAGAGLCGLALVFCGVQFPFDVLTGAFLGLAIGVTAVTLAGFRPVTRVRAVQVFGVWAGIGLWGGVLATALAPATAHLDQQMRTPRPRIETRVTPPAALVRTLRQHARPGEVTVEAATNGMITAVWLRVRVRDPRATLPEVTALSRTLLDDLFTRWPRASVATVTVEARQGGKTSTLFTASIPRAAWPPRAGILPGKKYYHPRYYTP